MMKRIGWFLFGAAALLSANEKLPVDEDLFLEKEVSFSCERHLEKEAELLKPPAKDYAFPKNEIVWKDGQPIILRSLRALEMCPYIHEIVVVTREELIVPISKLCADVCWAGHYFLLGGYGGAVTNAVGIFRELVFMQRGKHKWASGNAVPVIFIIINWCIGFSTFERPINILPIAASSFCTLALWVSDPKRTKLILAPVSASFLVYDIFIGSWIGVINESISLVSAVIFLIKEIKERKERKMSIFSSDIKTDRPEILIEGVEISEPAARINAADATE